MATRLTLRDLRAMTREDFDRRRSPDIVTWPQAVHFREQVLRLLGDDPRVGKLDLYDIVTAH